MEEEHKAITGDPKTRAVVLILTEVARAAARGQWKYPQLLRESIQWALRRRTVYDPGREALEHVAAALGIRRPVVEGEAPHQAPSRLAERIAEIAETSSLEKNRRM